MMRLVVFLILPFLITACKHKKNREGDEAYFPVLSFLQSQVKEVDSSLYRIVKLEKEGQKNTTTYIKREDFKIEAEPFLTLHELNSEEWNSEYEESKMIDEDLNRTIFTYTAIDKDAEVQRADVVLQRTPDYSNVENIIIHQVKNSGGKTIVRNMVWYVNKRFTIVTKTSTEKGSEKVNTVEVVWNDFQDQQTK